jgi:hypothetical protein
VLFALKSIDTPFLLCYTYTSFERLRRLSDNSFNATHFYHGDIMSTKSKVLSYLSKEGSYNTLTANKMQSVFGVANPSATINELRNEGHAIYLNTRINASGNKVAFYRLGTPTKRMVAAGIAAIRSTGERAFA